MKSKTGLHKKVAFIFDGTPASSQPAASAPAPAAAPGGSPQQGPPPAAGGTQPVSVAAPARSNSPRASAKSPARQPKNAAGSSGKQKKMDPKQRKMLVLIGILSVVMIGVLMFVFSSPAAPPKKAAAAAAPQADNPAAGAAGPVAWTKPEPWPKQIRDPMTVGAQARTNEGTQSECVVRGIVYSQTRPSAIIGNQIVFVGDTINGMTVIAIGRDSVELERDGQRWTQQVQR